MKIFVKAAALFIVAISFAACQKAENPVSPSTINKSTTRASTVVYNGTFEIMHPETGISGTFSAVSGTIIFSFDYAASTYKYDGQFSGSQADNYSSRLQGSGKFEMMGDNIKLSNYPAIRTTLEDYSLIFNGKYQYIEHGDQIIIKGDTDIGYITIVLN
jgi:opacity protein-like surface antigen